MPCVHHVFRTRPRIEGHSSSERACTCSGAEFVQEGCMTRARPERDSRRDSSSLAGVIALVIRVVPGLRVGTPKRNVIVVIVYLLLLLLGVGLLKELSLLHP